MGAYTPCREAGWRIGVGQRVAAPTDTVTQDMELEDGKPEIIPHTDMECRPNPR